VADRSSIEWTEATWNPVRGCTKVSEGCRYCYAEAFAERWRGIPGHPYEKGFDLRTAPELLDLPLRWKRPRMIFVNSMSDLFHEEVPCEFIQSVFDVMGRAPHHRFQVLTKRAKRLAELSSGLPWPPNIWLGVSIEDQANAYRLAFLQKVRASVRFVSFEPLLGPIDLDLAGVHWVIVGGESGPRARPMEAEWARAVRDRCRSEGVPFFFKQWGGKRKDLAGRVLDGAMWDEMPAGQKASLQGVLLPGLAAR
jgi:protein gp37